MNQSLFRPEVLAESQAQWLGTVLLAPRLSHRLFFVFATLAGGAVLSLLLFGQYTRKAQINGWLVPQQGMVRVFAPQAGVVSELRVREGSRVRKGAPLAVVSTELLSVTRGATQQEVARQLVARRDSLKAESEVQKKLHAQRASALSERIAALEREREHLEREIELQRERLALAEQSSARFRQLIERGFVSVQQLQEREEGRLDQALKLRDLERSLTNTKRDLVTLRSELQQLPLNGQTQLAQIERNIAELEQSLAEAESRRQLVIQAPQDGTVTAIQAELGGGANVTAPLLSILPEDSTLEAHLFSPSRSVGFLRAGQRVLLRYQAYPYQKFGQYEGHVEHVSRSALSPGELPPQLSGLASVLEAKEPVYRVTVRLARQAVSAYGKPVPLQPGMQVEASVVIEQRRLFEWMLDPLYTLTGNLHG